MKKLLFIAGAILMAMVLSQCLKDKIDEIDPIPSTVMEEIDVPDDFNFETTRNVSVDLSTVCKKAGDMVKYMVFLYDEDMTEFELNRESRIVEELPDHVNHMIANIVCSGSAVTDMEIPTYINQLYVIKDDNGIISSTIIDVITSGKKATAKAWFPQAKADYPDMIHIGWHPRYMFVSDLNGNTTHMPSTPTVYAAHRIAIDSKNGVKYHAGFNPDWRLLKGEINNYTTFEEVGNLGGPICSMTFNNGDGYIYALSYPHELWIPDNLYLYKIDPATGTKSHTWELMHNGNSQSITWACLTFAPDGKLYIEEVELGLCSVEAAALDESVSTIEINVIGNGGENDFITGMAFASDGQLYATNLLEQSDNSVDCKNEFGTINLETGALTVIKADFNVNGDFAIHHTNMNLFISNDDDADGVVDYYDEFPLDPDRATISYYPSNNEWRTVAFEDLWPSKGDYDFNDLIILYQARHIKNAASLEVEQYRTYKIDHKGGSFKNGLAIEEYQREVSLSEVAEYTIDRSLDENYITLDASGLEAGHDHIVQIIFDNCQKVPLGEVIETYIKWTVPRAPVSFYPFLIVNGERGREIHSPNGFPTNLADPDMLGTFDDDSKPAEDRYYKTKFNLPWNLAILGSYLPPVEKTPIVTAYPRFKSWVESGGDLDADWYLHPDSTKVQF